jgi:hypothetical protein
MLLLRQTQPHQESIRHRFRFFLGILRLHPGFGGSCHRTLIQCIHFFLWVNGVSFSSPMDTAPTTAHHRSFAGCDLKLSNQCRNEASFFFRNTAKWFKFSQSIIIIILCGRTFQKRFLEAVLYVGNVFIPESLSLAGASRQVYQSFIYREATR